MGKLFPYNHFVTNPISQNKAFQCLVSAKQQKASAFALGYRLTWEQLRDEVPLPCTVHWNQRYFVVVYRVKKRRAWGLGGEQGARGRAKTFATEACRQYV